MREEARASITGQTISHFQDQNSKNLTLNLSNLSKNRATQTELYLWDTITKYFIPLCWYCQIKQIWSNVEMNS